MIIMIYKTRDMIQKLDIQYSIYLKIRPNQINSPILIINFQKTFCTEYCMTVDLFLSEI